MFEIFKAILDVFAKALDPSALSRLVKERARDDLGARLFMLYVVIDEICLDGEALVGDLDAHVAKMSAYLARDDDRWALGGIACVPGLRARVTEQRANLVRLEQVLRDVEGELRVLDPSAYRQLKLLMHGQLPGKQRALGALHNLAPPAAEDRLPIGGPTDVELREVARELAEDDDMRRRIDEQGLYGVADHELAGAHRISGIQAQYARGLPLSTVWDEAAFDVLRRYLADRKPGRQLAEIRGIADSLKRTLDTVFPPSDLLWMVGSARFQKRYRRLGL